MRTTIELPEEKRALLVALAAKRGLRGYSALINEAIDFYLREHARSRADLEEIQRLAGTWSDDDVTDFRRRVAEVWKSWPR